MASIADDLGRKVEVMKQGLDNERRLRFELEHQIKSKALLDQESLEKMHQYKDRADKAAIRETDM